MKGKPVSTPTNHVEWINGFKSNMPDWMTARECSHASEMLRCLKECRTLMLTLSADNFHDEYYREKLARLLGDSSVVIDLATGMDVIKEALKPIAMSVVATHETSFPKPPGF